MSVMVEMEKKIDDLKQRKMKKIEKKLDKIEIILWITAIIFCVVASKTNSLLFFILFLLLILSQLIIKIKRSE